ncbi:hypothetical protein [Streptomyces aidingensis]|uniref:Uncharacterized protein n=1 Tax=Streptomyces aidingensis TaxID=910347 RepID=A0A1I1PRY2_9ACTN|nr:hypothetical protein [Streptomyces aidingensis]SFD12606.1 hypothetical protein SAMN05421773_11018 [Streptomyces aidingensis]
MADLAMPERCSAAHESDPTPCLGVPDAVTVVDAGGTEVDGCVPHAARLFAELCDVRLTTGPGGRDQDATAALRAALELPPSVWVGEGR